MLIGVIWIRPLADIEPQVASQLPHADTNKLAIAGNRKVVVTVAMHHSLRVEQLLCRGRDSGARPSRIAIPSAGPTFRLVPECRLQIPLEGSRPSAPVGRTNMIFAPVI